MTWLADGILLVLYVLFCYACWGFIMELRKARREPFKWDGRR